MSNECDKCGEHTLDCQCKDFEMLERLFEELHKIDDLLVKSFGASTYRCEVITNLKNHANTLQHIQKAKQPKK